MPVTKLADKFVDRDLMTQPAKLCRNPVTGDWYDVDNTSIAEQMDIARRALEVHFRHALTGAADMQPLPISARERDAMELKGTPLHYILGKFARSVERYYLESGLDVREHPTFTEYAAGFLWENELPAGGFAHLPTYAGQSLEELKKRIPPKMLRGMSPGATWLSPEEHREAIGSLRRCSRNPEAYFYRE